MAAPAYVSDPSVQFLNQVLDEISKAYIQIPAFQRSFVWTDDQRIDLLESIRDGIPIGSILVWRTTRADLKCVTQIGPHLLPEQPKDVPAARSYLLDGFQRMSTLFGCLRSLPPGVAATSKDDDGEPVSWRVGYDLSAQEFQVLEPEAKQSRDWLPLPILLDSVALLRFQRGLATDELVERADALAETFRTYKLPVIPVVTDDLAGATRTFERINRQGTPMTEMQMVRALTYTKDFDLTQKLLEGRQALDEVGWAGIELETVLRTAKAALDIDISVATPDELAQQLAKNSTAIAQAPRSLARAAVWLRDICNVPSYRAVPYLAQIVLLADAFRVAPAPNPAASTSLVRWFWQTTYTGEFRGLSGGRLLKQLRRVRALALGEATEAPLLRGTPDFALPSRFAAKQVRIVAAALQLARLAPRGLDGESVEANRQLAREGVAALVPLVRGRDVVGRLRGIANRFFVNPDSDIREALLSSPQSIPQATLESLAIDGAALDALLKKDWMRFGDARAEYIEGRERAHYNSLWPAEAEVPF